MASEDLYKKFGCSACANVPSCLEWIWWVRDGDGHHHKCSAEKTTACYGTAGSTLEQLKAAVMELTTAEQGELYRFMHVSLGCKIYRD